MNFTNLCMETNYSLNGSNIKNKDVVSRAVEFGYTSLAITDLKMSGVVNFYKECLKKGIKPIIGHTIYVEGILPETKNTILVYAKNNEGYLHLLRISSLFCTNGVITQSELKKYANHLIFIVKTSRSEIYHYYVKNQKNEFLESINMLLGISSEFYFSVSDNESLNQYFNEQNRLVVIDEVSYLNQDDYLVSNTLKEILSKETYDLFNDNKGKYFKSKEEIIDLYKPYTKAIENAYIIGEKCNVTLDFDQTYLPKYHLKKGVSSKDYLRALATKGLEKRLVGQTVDKKQYIDRLNYELNVIDSMGYNDYFLIVWDFVKYAKSKKYLVGPGRGSAAASLVSYCLGITSIDSIKYELVFERFLNPERITLPDIDMDLPDDKRDDIIQYVRDFYGVDRVASIVTFGTFLSKSALRDTARVLAVEGVLLEQILKYTQNYNDIKTAILESKEIQNIMQRDKSAQKLLEISSKIEGLNRHISTHAAGIIITSDELVCHTPLQSGLLDMTQTQYEAKDLEDLGLLKIDFLGLRNLTSIDNIVKLINETEGTNLDIYKVPVDDKKTFDLLKRVDTLGVFQLESQGMRSLIGQMQIDCFEDIVAILALFRPGPMENIPSYIRRRNQEEVTSYPHKILEEVLKNTHGIIVYQEQIIKIANLFAGYSLGEADLLRRAVSKKQESVLQKERSNFVKKAKEMGHDEKLSNEIYDYIVKFANYGFNRAHSVAYAMVSYWMSYLKANYPKYFISVMLGSVIGSETNTRNYIFEANSLGIKVLPPSINHSSGIYLPEKDNLRFPLLGIKSLGNIALTKVMEEREKGIFTSYVDFIYRVYPDLNKRIIESLIYASALDDFGFKKRTMIEKMDDVISYCNYGNFISEDEFILIDLPEYPFDVLEEKERQVLGFNLVMNPLTEYSEYIQTHQLYKPSTIDELVVGSEIRIMAVLSGIKNIKTKKNADMAFVTLQDEYSKIEGVLFDSTYRMYCDDLIKGSVYLFLAKVEKRNDKIQLIIQKIHKY
ncbi:MAG: DNA polymerase III subunit alpha [Bacilli bacterium]|nr:DNA polymerase III subunit alpha [Bacilli bacterium]